MKTIKINKKNYSIKFGWGAIRDFSRETNTPLNKFEEALKDLTVDHALTLIWAGLKQGARIDHKPFDFTIDDVADLMDDNPHVFQEAFDDLGESMGRIFNPNQQAVPAPPTKSRKK